MFPTIENIIKEAFKDNGIDIDTFNEDITCFNRDATRCSVVYDAAKIENTFIIVCLQGIPTISFGLQYELAMFEVRKDGHFGGIDAMHLAHNYLEGNYSLGTTHPELRKKLEKPDDEKDNTE